MVSDVSSNIGGIAAQELWQACLQTLQQELPAQQFTTWIAPLQVRTNASGAGDALVLEVTNRFKLDCIRTQYLQRIVELAQQHAGRPITVELVTAHRRIEPPKPAAQPAPVPQKITSNAVVTEPESMAIQTAPVAQPTRLDARYTFDTLVEGSANRMARAAALHVANAPGQLYNPLFIYGGVGLGKTHLLQAVGHHLLQANPQAKVLYTHAEQFVTDVVQSYQRKAFDKFKNRYHQLDLLLIDDVQFFAGKEKTQEEFFNAFEALLSKKSHIVMTSDTYPKGLNNITARLVSRFNSGLTVAIEPPEFEMRVAILMDKAQAEGYALSQEVAFFVAKNVRANVRELEGALQSILAYARFGCRPVDIALVREALRDLLSIKNRQIGVENIQKTVADFYKIKVADMHSKRRPAAIAKPRQIAMYLSKELTQKSLPEIGAMFGGRDHTTVLHAVRKITAERAKDTDLNQQLHLLEQTIKG